MSRSRTSNVSRQGVHNATLASLLLCFGCSQPTPPPVEVAPQPVPEVTVEVAKVVGPQFNWSMEQTFVSYLECKTREAQREFEIETEGAQRHGTYPVDLVAGDYQLHPAITTELFPGGSTQLRVDLPGAPNTPFVITRTEGGYRINVTRTDVFRQQSAAENFREENGLNRATLGVRVVRLEKQADGGGTAELQVLNRSEANVEQFRLTVRVRSSEQHDVQSETELLGGALEPGKDDRFTVKLESLPAANARLSFHLESVTVRTTENESFDATSFFRIK